MFVEDTFSPAPLGLKVTFIGHATLIVTYGDTVIHVDSVGEKADYAKLPKAGIVLVTHEHSDHLDAGAIAKVRTPETAVVVAARCAGKVPGSIVLQNGDSRAVKGIRIEAVPAYNVVHMRAPGAPFHPKGDGNGYVLTLGTRRLYVAGDTENTREMKSLKRIDVAFLPMNLPYTMTPEMVADAALAFRPKVLYPYHFGDTDTRRIQDLLASAKDIEVRIRPMS
ncbi:MAG: MBL fold metallo-hydrolase [Spirochaetia bacterium]|jgi:L-ascorbate metabolism protein UlaG (beta-lactamase superfamily)